MRKNKFSAHHLKKGDFLFIFAFAACMHEPVHLLSDHFDGRRFFNEDRAADVDRGFSDAFKMILTGNRKSWPDHVDDNLKPDFSNSIDFGKVAITHISHATEIIQVKNATILTDPVFSKRASPFSWMGSRRHRAPGTELSAIPKINIVLISHNHYDHMDITLQRHLILFTIEIFLLACHTTKQHLKRRQAMLPVIRCDEYLYPVPKFDLGKGDIKDFNNELKGFHEQFADCFQRSESRDHFFTVISG